MASISSPSMKSTSAASIPQSIPPCAQSVGSTVNSRIHGSRATRAATATKAAPPATSMISNALMANSASVLSNSQ